MRYASLRHLGSYPAVTGRAARVQGDAVPAPLPWPGAGCLRTLTTASLRLLPLPGVMCLFVAIVSVAAFYMLNRRAGGVRSRPGVGGAG